MVTINHNRNVKYFKRVSYKRGVILMVVGAPMLFSGAAAPIIIGLMLGGAGGYLIYRQVANRPSDEEIDRQVSAIYRELKERALRKLGLDEEEVKLIDPIIGGGPHLGSLGTNWSAKKGKDNVLRSSNYEGIVIFFGEQELHYYKYQISLITENESRELTDVYFYRDVVSVATVSDSIPVTLVGEQKQQVVNQEMFRLTTSGGTAVQCSVDAFGDKIGHDVQGARQLIREKKMHAV